MEKFVQSGGSERQLLGSGPDRRVEAKEISRFPSMPEEQDLRRAKRLARYLNDNKRIVIEYNFQRLPEKVVAWSDADFAGRKRTRRSASGGAAMFGNHCVKPSCQTQETIAWSLDRLETRSSTGS